MILHHSEQARLGVPVAPIQAAVDSVSAVELRAWVERLSRPRHRTAQARQNYATAEWIAARFAEWGYHVEIQDSLRNVVATPLAKPDRAIVVGAHYDSVPETPGADDNASAVAAMLACAKACAAMQDSAGIVYVAFNGEEDNLTGSRAFVKHLLSAKPYRVKAAHVLEMVGYASSSPGSQRVPPGLPVELPERGDFLGLVANQHTGPALPGALEAARTYVPGFQVLGLEVLRGLERHFPVLLRSDHASFWEQDLPAMMWTDTSEFRNPHYHTTRDLPDTLDYEYLQRVTGVLVASVLTMQLQVDG